jgi:hypothetical protein
MLPAPDMNINIEYAIGGRYTEKVAAASSISPSKRTIDPLSQRVLECTARFTCLASGRASRKFWPASLLIYQTWLPCRV